MILENVNALLFTDYMSDYSWQRPAGAYKIATELRKLGYTCQVIDCFSDMSDEQINYILNRAIGSNTLFVGITTSYLWQKIDGKTIVGITSSSHLKKIHGDAVNVDRYPYPHPKDRMLKFFDDVKNINERVKIVVGGAKAQHEHTPYADAIIDGFGEQAIIDYVNFLSGKNPFFGYKTNSSGQIIIHGDDSIGRYDFANSYIKYEPCDNMLQEETPVLEISRGCIFNCKFCTYAMLGKKKNSYIKNINVLREEVLRNYYEHGITHYYYSDDTHNDSIEKLQDLADMVQSLPFSLRYAATLRLDVLRAHPEQYQLLKDGGIKAAFFGIESFNHQSAKAVGKGLHPDKLIEELYKVEEQWTDVGTSGGFIVGLPHESKETLQEWTTKISDVNFPLDYINIQPLGINKNPLYFSEIDRNPEKWYSFQDEAKTEWHNGYFDKEWASKFCDDFNLSIRPRLRVGGWLTLISKNYAVSKFKKSMCFNKTYVKDLPFRMKEICILQRNDYKNKLFSS